MSKLGREVLDNWNGRPENKMIFIPKMMKEWYKDGRLTPFTKKIYEKFGPEIFRRSTIPLCYGDLAIARYMKDKNINCALEIGTWNGLPSACMAQYADKVITIDIYDRPEKYDLWKWLGIDDKIVFYLVRTEAEKEDLIKNIKFDFCLMDGAHNWYTYSDWMMVRKCGKVLFHEYWDKQKPVWDLVNSLPKNEVSLFDIEGELDELKQKEFAYWEKK